ncbi:hypothetical protein EKD04_005775 [Chloroflexales bacterium ZM16-3]|nr:hypothetical protein [Chloroflexales bacterium ZM16-3]
MRPALRDTKWLLPSIALLLLIRLGVQVALYRAGFISLTADEFGRTVVAANWSKHPALYWSGVWLPFHAYSFGAALLLKWELLWTPRLIAITVGCGSIMLIYMLASSTFASRAVGLVAAFLLAINPAHIWLSDVPLTELPTAALVFAGVWATGRYLKRPQPRDLILASGALALANGFRFESWIISALFSLTLLGQVLAELARRELRRGAALGIATAAAAPWIFPLAWVVGNYVQLGDPLYFMGAIRAYKLQWYGDETFYGKYVETFLKLDPYLTWLGVPAIITCLALRHRSRAVQWYVTITVIPLIAYMILHGGQLEPPGNYIRYLAGYMFLFYPALAYMLVRVAGALPLRQARWALLVAALGLATLTQVPTAFQFTNDPATDGLAVGQAIRALRTQDPDLADRPVIIELSYWQYLAIHVGANDMGQIVYDRTLDIESRASQSLILTDEALFRSCLGRYRASYIIVKDPHLRAIIESNLRLLPTQTINGYSFYPVSNSLLEAPPVDHAVACPLSVGTGY